jgi:tetratricopeptide (TPR) repeat protein
MLWPCWSLRILVVIACIGGWAVVPASAADWPVPRGPAHTLAPHAYDPAQVKQLPREFLEEYAACVLYSNTTCLVEADGTVETIMHEIIRLNARKGIDDLGEYAKISFDPSFEKPTLNEARIFKADGRTIPLQPADVHLRDENTDYHIYDPSKQLVLSFPTLEVNDTVEVQWTVRGKNPEFDGQFFTYQTFGSGRYPIGLEEFSVCLPRNKAFKHTVVGGQLEAAVRDEGANRIYSWRGRQVLPLPPDDGLPSVDELRPRVVCSTLNSWEEVDRWHQRLFATCWECTPEMRQVVQQVTKDLRTPKEKARALVYWVRRHIRYLSKGVQHGFKPHPPSRVFVNRHGDCKDQSHLLAVLLRQAGVPAALVGLSPRDYADVVEGVPSPLCAHAIVLVQLDGQDHWIDPVYSEAGWDFLPLADRNRLAYVMDAEAAAQGRTSIRLVRTPAMTRAENRIETTTRMRVDVDGTARCEQSEVYHGQAALAQRELWLEVPGVERSAPVIADLHLFESQTRLTRLTVDENNLRDFDQPVTAKVEFETPGHFTGRDLLGGEISPHARVARLLSYSVPHTRKTPLDLGAPFELRNQYIIELPPAYTFEDEPASHTVHSPWGSFSRTVSSLTLSGQRRLGVMFVTKIDKSRVEPADFAAFRDFQKEISKHFQVYLTLHATTDPADAKALEEALTRKPADAVSARILATLYHGQGKYEDARRVVQQAIQHNPKDQTLLELALLVARSTEWQGTADRATVHYQLAQSYFDRGKAQQARENLDAAEEADPSALNTVGARLLQVQVYEALHQRELAVAAAQKALLLAPDNAEVLEGCVRLYLAADNRPEALRYLRRYVTAAGTDSAKLALAAELCLRLNRADEAFELATQASQQPKETPPAFSASTTSLLGSSSGQGPFLAAFALFPGRTPDRKAVRVLGLIHVQHGEHDKAILCLEKAVLDAPVLEGLIRSYLALGKLRLAEQCLQRRDKIGQATPSLEKACDLVKSLVQRRTALLAEARLPPEKAEAGSLAIDHLVCAEQADAEARPAKQVEALLTGAFAGGVEIGPALALRGRLALEKGRLSRAQTDAERCLVLSPKDAMGHYVRGRVRLERGQAGALCDLEQAAQLTQRKNAAILHWLARALFQANRFKEAVDTQKAAVALSPQEAELADQLQEFTQQTALPRTGP